MNSIKVNDTDIYTSRNIEFMNACFINNVHKVKEILDGGGVDINFRNFEKYTMFIIACRYKQMEIIKLLLKYRYSLYYI